MAAWRSTRRTTAPPKWIGRPCPGAAESGPCPAVDPTTGQLQRKHLRGRRGWHHLQEADRPARTPAKTLALLGAAKQAGASISAICDHIDQHAGIRRVLGVLALARKHGPAVVEDAAKALSTSGYRRIAFCAAISNAGRCR